MRKILQFFTTILYYITHIINTVATKRSERSRVVIISVNNNIAVLTPWLSDGYWHLPGGGVKRGEDPAEGARREVEEELGLKLSKKQIKFVKQIKFNAKGFKWDLDIFVAKLNDEPALSPLWYEISRAKWVDPKELVGKKVPPDLLICLKNCYNKDYV